MLLSLTLGAILAALVAGTAQEAEATFPGTNGMLVFISTRTTGTGVDNPTGDNEIFTINPDGTKVVYLSSGVQASNSQGDLEVYRMNILDGSGKKNLTNDAGYDYNPDWGVQAM